MYITRQMNLKQCTLLYFTLNGCHERENLFLPMVVRETFLLMAPSFGDRSKINSLEDNKLILHQLLKDNAQFLLFVSKLFHRPCRMSK